jgi:ABC-type lipoprotein release transport system permease subunit
MAENKYSRGMMKNQYLNVKGQLEGGIKIKDATRIYVSFSAGADYFEMGNATFTRV